MPVREGRGMSRELEGWISVKAERHRPDEQRGGCTCGFCAWSVEHVAIMAYREALDEVPA